jgi:hypothetical protein
MTLECPLTTKSGHTCSLVTFVTGRFAREFDCRGWVSGAVELARPYLWRLHEARIDEPPMEGQDFAARLTTEISALCLCKHSCKQSVKLLIRGKHLA